MDSGISYFLNGLGTNKMFVGLTMILMNMGSRFVIADLSPIQQNLLNNVVVKPIIIFCMFFVPTRDVMASVMLTFAFFFIIQNLLDDNTISSFIKKDKDGFVDVNTRYLQYQENIKKRA